MQGIKAMAAGLCALAMAGACGLGAAHGAPVTPGERLQRLQTALEREEAVRAIKRLQYALGHDLEEGRWAALEPLFTANVTGRFGAGEVAGRPAVVRHFMAEAGRSTEGLGQGQLNEHLLLQPIVTLGPDGRTAKATWHEVTMTGLYGAAAGWAGGVWENDYVLRAGAWRISALRFFRQYQGDYADAGQKAPAKWDIPYHFEARHVGLTIPASALRPDPQAPTPRAGDLELRARRLADETAVTNLENAFGYYLDRKLWDDVADLFAPEGTMALGARPAVRGGARIRKALEADYGAPALRRGELFDHILLATIVTLSPDGRRALARTTQLGQIGLNGQGARWELGTFENSFVRQGGVWKLAAVRFYPRMTSDYDKGWAKDAGAGPWPHTVRIPVSFSDPGSVGVPAGSVAPEAGSIDDAKRQVRAAVAVDAMENLNSSYGYYIDEDDWDGMSDTYARSGSKELTAVGVYVGPDRIRKALKLRGPLGGRSARFYTIHQLTQPVIDVSPDGLSAKGRFRLFQMGGAADGSAGSWIGGIYENTAVFEDGEWKFGVQDLHHLYNAPYKGGWARVTESGLKGGPRAGGLADQMPPDHPIRVQRQYAFPDIVEPAFHYRNPVSGRMPAELLP